jgi:hypothetical protein
MIIGGIMSGHIKSFRTAARLTRELLHELFSLTDTVSRVRII